MRILLLLMVGQGTYHAYFKMHDYLFHERSKIFKLEKKLLKIILNYIILSLIKRKKITDQ